MGRLEYSPEEYQALIELICQGRADVVYGSRFPRRRPPFLFTGIAPEPPPRSSSGYRVYEVPITYDGRGYDEGKTITWRDGFAARWVLLKYRFTE